MVVPVSLKYRFFYNEEHFQPLQFAFKTTARGVADVDPKCSRGYSCWSDVTQKHIYIPQVATQIRTHARASHPGPHPLW